MNDAAEREGFLVLYPEQPAVRHPQKCWNWYAPDQVHRDQGEVALLFALIDSVARAENIGAGRVSVVGMSAGGAMAANLAAAYPERVAALGIHSGIAALAALDLESALKVMREGADASALLDGRVVEGMGPRARAIPVIALHGADDKVVTPANLDRIVDQWTKVNLKVSPQARTPVERHLVPGVGHAWSGGAADASYTAPSGPDATGMIVEFLKRVGAIG
jgi:poly(hydroxyalkanoate) depolymerase family esterase